MFMYVGLKSKMFIFGKTYVRMVRHTIPDEGFEPSTTGLKVQRSTD